MQIFFAYSVQLFVMPCTGPSSSTSLQYELAISGTAALWKESNTRMVWHGDVEQWFEHRYIAIRLLGATTDGYGTEPETAGIG